MTRHGSWLSGAALAVVLLAATPGAAATLVHFSFTAGPTPVQGIYTLDCPPGDGPCTILSMTGTFGALPMSQTGPPLPDSFPPTDNLLTRPGFQPTDFGADFDFWPAPIVMVLSKDEEARLKAEIFERDQAEFVEEYTVTDYHTSVPEPAAWALMLVGFGGLGASLRARRAATA